MKYNWVCTVCESSVDKEAPSCETCGCPSDVSGEEFYDRKWQWDKEVEKHGTGASVLEIARNYHYIRSTREQMESRSNRFKNKFGTYWALIILYTPLATLFAFRYPNESAFQGFVMVGFFLFLIRGYISEVLKRPKFIWVSLLLLSINFGIAIFYSFMPRGSFNDGVSFVILITVFAANLLFSCFSKDSKAINNAYNNSHHSQP